ncbi:hypothetical protein D3C78_1823490 [compost metagenome]
MGATYTPPGFKASGVRTWAREPAFRAADSVTRRARSMAKTKRGSALPIKAARFFS